MGDALVLSVQEVADSLGVSRNVIYRSIASGEIPARKLGGRVVISRSWRDAFVASIDPAAPQAVAS